MIVTEPNDFAVDIHDRMPVFLSGDHFAPWLSGEAGAAYNLKSPLFFWSKTREPLAPRPA
jgi:putative SOS response-associated peptidase YedK